MQKLFFVVLFAFTGLFSHTLQAQTAEPFSLPKLPYAYNALEPYIDAQTMEIHYSRHHNAYVTNLNRAVKGTRYEKMDIRDMLLRAGQAGDAIRNNGGGHYNHTLFWEILGMNKPFNPQSELGKAVIATFGSYDSLRTALNNAGATRFGSGWAWLYLTPEKKLAVCSSPNQDNPIMDVSPQRGIPVLGIDVWEHAYYLKYQNRRGDYLGAIWNVINWEAVDAKYIVALQDPFMKAIAKDMWTELKAFHPVLSETYHAAQKGDFKPVYSPVKLTAMGLTAMELKKAPVPSAFDTPEMGAAIDRLVKNVAELGDLTKKKKKNDAAVMQSLTKVHDAYREIQSLCNN